MVFRQSDSWASSDEDLPMFTTQSELQLNVSTQDDGSAVACAAYNPEISQQGAVQNSTTISVLCKGTESISEISISSAFLLETGF